MEIFTTPVEYRDEKQTGRPTKHNIQARMLIAQKVVEKELTYREAARLYSVSHSGIARYVKEYKKNKTNSRRRELTAEKSTDRKDYRHQAEVKSLKQEIADLYLENQMLKKFLHKSLTKKKENGSMLTSESLDQLQEPAK